MSVTHISFDIETWGKRAGYDIRSIGAWAFSLELEGPGTVLDSDDHPRAFYVACENPKVYISGNPDNPDSYGLRYDLRRDPETIKWWSEQSAKAQAAFDHPVDLRIALERFAKFIHSFSNDIKHGQARDIRLWSHGAAFDVPILEAAYHAVGLTVPWFYRTPRDTRTVFDLAGIDNHSDHLAKWRSGPLHHAFYDAISQSWAIYAAYVAIDVKKPG